MKMEFHKEFVYAQKIIVEAGKLILSRYKENHTISFKSDSTWVTSVDKEIELFIRDKLTAIFPLYGFIGEEGDAEIRDISWIVDPLDGTVAFSRHIPEFGIAIAFKSNNTLIFSVQYIPLTDILLTAYLSHGAYCNGKKITINKKPNDKLLLSLSIQTLKENQFQKYTLNLVEKYLFRVGHSSILESYYLVRGKTNIYIRFEQPIWDTAPEILLMKEAGAIITDEKNRPLKLYFSKSARHNLIATNSYINKTLHHLYIK